jgi:GNAT superfamily N-acetyltransferase
MGDSIKIREGVIGDIPAILNLIQELAVYEKAGQEVITTVEQMEIDGFGKDRIFYFLVAESNDEIVGLALYYFKYSTWKGKGIYLDDIVVTESHRRMGIGSMLLDELIRVADKQGAMKLEWQVLDWNVSAIDFYKKYKVNFDSEWVNCMMNRDMITGFEKRES